MPKYTCPTCRGNVKRRPAIVYKLKDVVRIVGKAEGEEEENQEEYGRGVGNRAREGPFGAYFRSAVGRGYVVGA